jgi:hypothetical protein
MAEIIDQKPLSGTPSIVKGKTANRPSRWEAPFTFDGSQGLGDALTSWVREAVSEGEWFLRNQTGHRFVDVSHRIMADVGFNEVPETLSNVSINFVKRDVREMVGLLANPRPLASFKCEATQFQEQADLLNKGYLSWYNTSFVDREIWKALYYAAVDGTGYLLTEWDPGFWAPGKGDVRPTPLGVDSVLPIQIPAETWDLQEAYAVVIRRQFPITYLMKRFPHVAHRLVPDGEDISRWRRMLGGMKDIIAATVHNTYGSQRGYRGEDPSTRHLVTVYDVYIQDYAINNTGRDVLMGQVGSPWEYIVPSYGSPMPRHLADPQTRVELKRPANMHDARMYPMRRHLVTTRNSVLYDGTSRWWHGQVPLVKFVLDSSPYEYCGIPLTKEPAKAQAAVTSLLRAYDDASNARLRPPVAFDGSRVNPAMARAVDPRMGGQVVEMSNMIGEPFKLLIDSKYYDLGVGVLEFIQWIKEEGTRLMGLHDVQDMAKAAQIPSGDTMEKLQELAGPLATDMSRNMEKALKCLADQFKALFFEFYTVPRRFSMFGPDGITKQDLDFDPAQLVPDDLALPGLGPKATRAQRARAHMLNFEYSIVPNSVYQMTQSTRKLQLVQLAKLGMPISPLTILEQFDIPNPEKEFEKWKEFQIAQGKAAIEVQAEVQQAALAADPMGQLAGVIQGAMGMSPEQTQGNPGPGRKPSGQQSPHLEVKQDEMGGQRTTIAES